MHEHLDLGLALADNPADVVQVEFPGQYHPLEPQLLQLPNPQGVVNGHLGRCVEREAGEVAPDQAGHSQILDDDSVGPHLFQGRKSLHQHGEFRLLDQGVEGDVDPFPLGVGVAYSPLHEGKGEVFGSGPG